MQAAEPRSTHSRSLVEAVATEIGWDRHASPDGLLFLGECPACGERLAFLWDYRLARRDKSWGCVGCGAGGDVFDLCHRVRKVA